MLKKLKYHIIILYSTMSEKSVVDIFGGTYVVAGNFVRRIR